MPRTEPVAAVGNARKSWHLPKGDVAKPAWLGRLAAERDMINLGSPARSLEEGELMVERAASGFGTPWSPLFHCRDFVTYAQSIHR